MLCSVLDRVTLVYKTAKRNVWTLINFLLSLVTPLPSQLFGRRVMFIRVCRLSPVHRQSMTLSHSQLPKTPYEVVTIATNNRDLNKVGAVT